MDPNAPTETTPPQQPPPAQQRDQMQAQPQQVQQYPLQQGPYAGLQQGPYASQPGQYGPQQVPIRASDMIPFSKPWHTAKIVLGTISLVCCIIIYGVGIYSLTIHSYYYDEGYRFSLAGAAAGLALVWQCAEFITICASSKHRGIHPGANVALHLVIWILSALAVAFETMLVVIGGGYYDIDTDERYAALEAAILAFLCILLIVHFTLFVRACVETHQYNSVSRTVYVPISMVPPSYNYYPVAPQPQQPMVQMTVPPQQGQQPQMVAAPQHAHLYGHYAPVYTPKGASVDSTPSPPPQGQPGPHSVSPVTSSV